MVRHVHAGVAHAVAGLAQLEELIGLEEGDGLVEAHAAQAPATATSGTATGMPAADHQQRPSRAVQDEPLARWPTCSGRRHATDASISAASNRTASNGACT